MAAKCSAPTACFTCHRFGNEGGMTGPDLTSAGRRYAPRDLLDQIINPSKEINEQYVPMVIVTNDEEVFQGVVVNLKGDAIEVNTDPLDPNQRQTIDRKEIASIAPSKVSPMPTGLLSVLTQEEILDLLAYLLSGGDPAHDDVSAVTTAISKHLATNHEDNSNRRIDLRWWVCRNCGGLGVGS